MKTGDLVKLKKSVTKDFNETFLVSDVAVDLNTGSVWIKHTGRENRTTTGWTNANSYEVISESRRQS